MNVWRLARLGVAVALIGGLLSSAVPPLPARGGGELLPDLAMAPLRDFRIEWVDGRRLLRFTAMMVNQGPGHFEVRGHRTSASEPMLVDQVTYRGTSRSETNIARQFATGAVAQYAGDGHNHWHVQDMMRYDLWGGGQVVADEKIGFCFLDSDRYFGADPRYYRGSWCSTDPNALSNRMGISVGWGDLYAWNYAWQWVDISSAPSGSFALRATVDPYGWFAETNDSNQCSSVTLSWTGQSNHVTVHGQDASCWNDWGSTEFAADVAWAFDAGVTQGCGYNLYCTAHTVRRDQMASFLVRALRLPPSPNDYFWDDHASDHQADINSIFDARITVGCGQGIYCPYGGVLREQMASFLARALSLAPASQDFFSDDNGSLHEDDINRIAQAGITLGCGGTLFCPSDAVSRGQMAAFLHRAMAP